MSRRLLSINKAGALRLLLGASLLPFVGCDRLFSTRESTEEILKADPGFAQTLARRSEIDAQIRSLKQKLADKRHEMNEQIRTLQREYRVYAGQISEQIRLLITQLDPERQHIKQETASLKAELHIKDETRRTLVRVQRDAERLLARNDTSLSAAERTSWEQKLDSTSQELSALDAEVAHLKDRIRLLDLKLRALRQ